MSQIWDWLQLLVQLLLFPFKLIFSLLSGLVFIIQAFFNFLPNVLLFFDWIPPEFAIYVTAFIGLAIFYKVAGRD